MDAFKVKTLHFINGLINKHIHANIFAKNITSFIKNLGLNNHIFQQANKQKHTTN